MKLSDIIDQALLERMLEDGYIRRQVHPTLPLYIYNYAEKAQFENEWNDATRQCRGLIVEQQTNEVIARPFRKFMNWGQVGAGEIAEDEDVVVTDKMDGSLGIVFYYGGDYHVATRGSFTSDQAAHATRVFRERYSYIPPDTVDGVTLLVEIIYPQNRIVLDYGDHDDLVLLGGMEIDNGKSYTISAVKGIVGWRGPVAREFDYASLVEAIAAPPRENAEGLVVHGLRSDERIKIKQEDYVRLHRIVTGLSTRTVWEHLGEGKPLAELLEPLPEEFHDWVREVAEGLFWQSEAILDEVERTHAEILNELPDGWTRKDYALVARETSRPGYLFLALDGQGQRLSKTIWRDIKPERVTLPPGMNQHTEDTA